jgi:mycothiol synthase
MTVSALAPEQLGMHRAQIEALAAKAEAADGRPPLNENVWLDLEHPRPDSAGFFVDGNNAYAHIARADTTDARRWSLGIVVAPDARATNARVTAIAAAVDHVARHGGGLVTCWIAGATDDDTADLAACDFSIDRELHELRVPLPIVERPQLSARFAVRTFEPGRDDEAWVEVNNRAFAGHAEQGGWTIDTLERRIAEAWFDPNLFLLAFDDDGLAGFNWCKVHAATAHDPTLGEIFVIGIDPRAQGTGLGRALAITGLDRLHDCGIKSGSLFVAAENVAALKLYHSLGFTVHRTDRAYEREVDAI